MGRSDEIEHVECSNFKCHYIIHFFRMCVLMAVYDHIRVDINSFLHSDHFNIMKEMLKAFPLKLVIISKHLGIKENWV